MKKTRMEKGITLIALIITIVVLMILAAVAITAITNEGILNYANNAVIGYEQEKVKENTTLDSYQGLVDKWVGNLETGNPATTFEEVTLATAITDAMYARTANSQTSDIYGNVIKIPAGFKILVDSTTVYTGTTDIAVEKGIVITDGTNEFVYVPVGNIKTASATKPLTLARYEFEVLAYDETGTATGFGTGAITETHTLATDELTDALWTGLGLSDFGCFVEGKIEGIDDQNKGYALNLIDFMSKASSGYYIGRYEARTTSSTERVEGDELTDLTLNKGNAIYDLITQPDAISKCQSMYINKPFITDLINSFAWDTAIAFIQSFEDTDYSVKTTVNSSFSKTGTVGLETEDKVCNIYDMASNCAEWSTETNSVQGKPCTVRGSLYVMPYPGPTVRWNSEATACEKELLSFRPILYL